MLCPGDVVWCLWKARIVPILPHIIMKSGLELPWWHPRCPTWVVSSFQNHVGSGCRNDWRHPETWSGNHLSQSATNNNQDSGWGRRSLELGRLTDYIYSQVPLLHVFLGPRNQSRYSGHHVIAAGSAMDVFWLVFKQRGSWAILGHLDFVG